MNFGVKFWARAIEVLCMVMIAFMVISPIMLWFFPGLFLGDTMVEISVGYSGKMKELWGFDPESFSLLKRIGLYLMGAVGTAFIVYGLVLCVFITRLWAQGKIFTENTVALFAQLKKTMICWAVYGFPQLIWAYTVLMPGTPLSIKAMSVAMTALSFFIVYAFFTALGALVRRGTKLQKDQDLTV